MGESTALPQSTTNDIVSNKICYVYMNLFTKMMYNENHKKGIRTSTSIWFKIEDRLLLLLLLCP